MKVRAPPGNVRALPRIGIPVESRLRGPDEPCPRLNMRARLLPLLLVMLPDLLMTAAVAAEPAGMPDAQDRAAYIQARKRVDVQYTVAQSECKRFTGEARDYCREQAKGEYSAAMLEVQKRYPGGARDAATQAAYDSEIQACRTQGGEARKHCVLDVEMRYR